MSRGKVPSLDRIARENGLTYSCVIARWYRGKRGRALTAAPTRHRRRRTLMRLRRSPMYVQTSFGVYKV
jgi:hypothetical protein